MHEFLMDFITRHKEQPFYVHYAMSHMHAKILPTPDSKDATRSKATSEELYADNNAYMDKLVGKLVADLEKLGLREKTLLVFVGDNGTAPDRADEAPVDGRPISGRKGTMLEGGSRVPLIVNWPGTTPAGKVNHDLTDFTDFMPTFAEFAGAKLPEGVKIDGHSFAPQIKGQRGTPREWVYVQLAGERYVRDARWKLTGTGEFFDLKGAPFTEVPVAADSTDADAKASREKLKAVLDDLIAQDKITGDTPARKKKDKKKKKALKQAPATTTN
jgi:arylsulfatase A